MTFRPLPQVFNRAGFRCRIVQRTETVALIHVVGTHYEVALIRRLPASRIMGTPVPAREALPSNEEWGSRGWSFLEYAAALQKYNDTVACYKRSEVAA